jgi:hypothetical protein
VDVEDGAGVDPPVAEQAKTANININAIRATKVKIILDLFNIMLVLPPVI